MSDFMDADLARWYLSVGDQWVSVKLLEVSSGGLSMPMRIGY